MRMKVVPIYTNLVEHLIKVAELCHLLHDLLLHEERCVDGRVAMTMEHPHSQLDQSLLQPNCRALCAMVNNLSGQVIFSIMQINAPLLSNTQTTTTCNNRLNIKIWYEVNKRGTNVSYPRQQ